MSKRKILMKRKIAQAVARGHHASIVMPKNMKRKSLMKLFTKAPVS